MVDFNQEDDVDSIPFTRMSEQEIKDSLPAFEVLPAGSYPLCVKGVKAKTTKAGGKMLSFQFAVEDGPHRGRVIFQNENIIASPEKRAQDAAKADALEKMGAARISTLMSACGYSGAKVSDLVGSSFIGVVAVRPAQNGYEASNEVKRYQPANGGAVASAPVAAAGAPAQKNVPAFMRKAAQA